MERALEHTGEGDMTLTPTQQTVLESLLALRKLTHETGTVTRRTQGRVLQGLSEVDLTAVARALSEHQEQMGW